VIDDDSLAVDGWLVGWLAPLSVSGTFRTKSLIPHFGEWDVDLFHGWTLDLWTSGKHLVEGNTNFG
jgi:hypothetical protein